MPPGAQSRAGGGALQTQRNAVPDLRSGRPGLRICPAAGSRASPRARGGTALTSRNAALPHRPGRLRIRIARTRCRWLHCRPCHRYQVASRARRLRPCHRRCRDVRGGRCSTRCRPCRHGHHMLHRDRRCLRATPQRCLTSPGRRCRRSGHHSDRWGGDACRWPRCRSDRTSSPSGGQHSAEQARSIQAATPPAKRRQQPKWDRPRRRPRTTTRPRPACPPPAQTATPPSSRHVWTESSLREHRTDAASLHHQNGLLPLTTQRQTERRDPTL